MPNRTCGSSKGELQAKVAFAKKKIARVLASLMCRILIQAVRVLKYFKHVSHTLG